MSWRMAHPPWTDIGIWVKRWYTWPKLTTDHTLKTDVNLVKTLGDGINVEYKYNNSRVRYPESQVYNLLHLTNRPTSSVSVTSKDAIHSKLSGSLDLDVHTVQPTSSFRIKLVILARSTEPSDQSRT